MSRGVSGPGKPASQFWQRGRQGRVRGFPRCARCRRRKGYGDAPRAAPRLRWGAAATAGVRVMETHAVRRPVYGGAARIGRKEMTAQRYRAGGPGVPWTPGRRPPHRNGGARRLSGYAAKSRSDAPTGGALSEPVPLFPAADQAANAKGPGPCLTSTRSRKNNSSQCSPWNISNSKNFKNHPKIQTKPFQTPPSSFYWRGFMV